MTPQHPQSIRQSLADGLVEIAGTIAMTRRRAEELNLLSEQDGHLNGDMKQIVEALSDVSQRVAAFRRRLSEN